MLSYWTINNIVGDDVDQIKRKKAIFTIKLKLK